MRHEYQRHVRRRLLERLEEAVLRFLGHPMRFVHDRDLPAAAARPLLEERLHAAAASRFARRDRGDAEAARAAPIESERERRHRDVPRDARFRLGENAPLDEPLDASERIRLLARPRALARAAERVLAERHGPETALVGRAGKRACDEIVACEPLESAVSPARSSGASPAILARSAGSRRAGSRHREGRGGPRDARRARRRTMGRRRTADSRPRREEPARSGARPAASPRPPGPRTDRRAPPRRARERPRAAPSRSRRRPASRASPLARSLRRSRRGVPRRLACHRASLATASLAASARIVSSSRPRSRTPPASLRSRSAAAIATSASRRRSSRKPIAAASRTDSAHGCMFTIA